MLELDSKTPESEALPKPDFIAKLEKLWEKGNFVCVGLDSEFSKIPQRVKTYTHALLLGLPDGYKEEVIFQFNSFIVSETHDLVCAYKPNSAFYEAEGEDGMRALKRTVDFIKREYPEIPVILDAKRADIGSTNNGYVQAVFDQLGVDAITVHPYLGREAMKPFLDRKDKGIIVLARTSNPGAGEFQDLPVGQTQEPLYKVIARQVAQSWNINGNCGVVVGATYPKELAEIRAIVGDMPILIPGIGAQGGDVEATVKAGKDSRSWGMIINSSRGIIFASQGDDYAVAARSATAHLAGQINEYR